LKIDPLDKLFSEYIRRRAIVRVGGCERCLSIKPDTEKENGTVFPGWKQLQCSHFWGRGKISVRWDQDNAAGLCGGCHMYLTAHPEEHRNWFMTRLGADDFDLLMGRAFTPQKPDIEALTIYLKEMIKEVS